MAELSVVPMIDGPDVALPPSVQPEKEPDVSMVPVASGRVHVLAAVRSADVIVPVCGATTPVDCGRIAIWSELAVEEAKTAEPIVPSVLVISVAGAVFIIKPPVPASMVVELAPEVFPIVTFPVEVPVLILVAKLELAFKSTVAPVEVIPDSNTAGALHVFVPATV